MKCCGSPITSTARNVIPGEKLLTGQTAPPGSAPREVAAQFEALLMKSVFAPVARALGFYGDLVVGEVATAVARQERAGLTDRLVALIAEAHHAPTSNRSSALDAR